MVRFIALTARHNRTIDGFSFHECEVYFYSNCYAPWWLGVGHNIRATGLGKWGCSHTKSRTRYESKKVFISESNTGINKDCQWHQRKQRQIPPPHAPCVKTNDKSINQQPIRAQPQLNPKATNQSSATAQPKNNPPLLTNKGLFKGEWLIGDLEQVWWLDDWNQVWWFDDWNQVWWFDEWNQVCLLWSRRNENRRRRQNNNTKHNTIHVGLQHVYIQDIQNTVRNTPPP